MMKIFFMCTHSNQGTGYARSANIITNYLADLSNIEVVYYAFQNFKGQDITDRYINPKIKFIDAVELDPDSPKGFGDKGIIPSFEHEKPDVLFLYNDLPVSVSILKMLENSKHKHYTKVCYLDLVYPWEDIERLEYLKKNLDLCYVFLNCWRDHLVNDLGFDSDDVEVLPLGVDTKRFTKISSVEAKKNLGFKEDDFLVVNMNRNSYRKQWCTTISAFVEFLKDNDMNPRIKLFCGCLQKTEDGYDIPKVVHTECLKFKIDPEKVMNNHIFVNQTPLMTSEEKMNMIYNAGDVGMNTCCGEGFGLTNLEHGILEKPQIVSGVHAHKETLGKHAILIEPKVWTSVSQFESHGGDIALFDSSDFAKALNIVFRNKMTCPNLKKHIEENFSWTNTKNVLKNMFAFF